MAENKFDPTVMVQLESAAEALIEAFDIKAPPIPIETMLQEPRDGMWEQLDYNKMSGTFMAMTDQYSPRMSMARLLARQVIACPWGEERGLAEMIGSEGDYVKAFARMLIMPREMVNSLTGSTRNPAVMNIEFEVPEESARKRLTELR